MESSPKTYCSRSLQSGRNYQQHVYCQNFNNVNSRENEQDTIVYDRVTISAVEFQRKTELPPINVQSSSSGSDIQAQCRLLVCDGVIGDKFVKILIDSGASTNLIRTGLAFKVLSLQTVQARRIDGTWTSSQPTKKVEDTIRIKGMKSVHGMGPTR